MSSLSRSVLILAILAGCYAPPRAPMLTEGVLTTGIEAETFVRRAGVVQVELVFAGLGNGIFVDENRLLSARHVIDRTDVTILLDHKVSPVEIIQMGERSEVAGDWAIARTELTPPVRPCQFEPASSIHPDQEALVVGHWIVPGQKMFLPVTIDARIVEVPEVFRPGVGELVCIDMGPDVDRYSGLSGSAVLVKERESGEWRLAGVYTNTLTSERGEEICGFVPLSLIPLRH